MVALKSPKTSGGGYHNGQQSRNKQSESSLIPRALGINWPIDRVPQKRNSWAVDSILTQSVKQKGCR